MVWASSPVRGVLTSQVRWERADGDAEHRGQASAITGSSRPGRLVPGLRLG